MPDNITLNSGTGGATLATDLIGSVQHQRVKVQYGTDGNATDVSDTNPMPVDDAGGSLTVDNGGTFVVQEDGAALTALQVIDNPVVVDDAAFTPATTSVMMAGFEFDDTTPDSVDEGDAGAARMSARREVYMQLRDAAGNERGLNVDANGDIGVTLEANNAGTLAVDASGTAVPVTDNGGSLTVDGTVSVDLNASTNTIEVVGDAAENAAVSGNPVLTGGRYDATPRTLGDGDVGAIALDADGAVQVSDGGNTLTVDGTVTADAGSGPWPVTDNGGALTVDWNGTAPPIGSGVEATALRVTVANDSTGVLSVDDNGSTLSIDDGGGDISIDWAGTAPPIGAGTEAAALRVTLATDSTGVVSIDDNGSSLTVDGSVSVAPTTSGGLSIFRSLDVDETEAEAKGTAGQVYGWYVYNNATSTRYLKFYNATAASVTVGITTPVLTIPIPASSAANVEYTNGIEFDTAITVAATTAVGDADTGAPAANDVVLNLFYS